MKSVPFRAALCLATAVFVATGFEAVADVSVTLKRQAKAEKPDRGRTGEQALIDASGFEYFINTDITFTTSSSASGAASEASYTGSVNADTSGGGTVASTLNDAFDGDGSLCVSTDGGIGPCVSGGGGGGLGGFSYTMYNNNGGGTTECGGRQVVLNAQTIGSLSVQRKVYVPDTDEFIRFFNVVTNNGAGAVTVNLIASNNLGSDANTTITATDSGDTTATTADRWVASFEAFSGTTSTDPRLAHVFYGAGASVGINNLTFVNGDDNPFWSYSLTLQPGETRAVAWFVTGQETRAAAAAKGAELAEFGTNAQACLSATEIAQVANFGIAGPVTPVVEVPTSNIYGLMVLAALLLGAGLVLFRRS